MGNGAAQVISHFLAAPFPLIAKLPVLLQFCRQDVVPLPHATIFQVIIIIGVVTILITF